MPVEKINWDKHDVVECDDRGRATIGREYANKRVFVYVAEIPDSGELINEPIGRDKSEVLSNMLSWARKNDIDTMTHLLNPKTGIVTDKKGDTYESPHSLEN